ncbi:MAG TPA: DEAD/DEAH box helicase family protein [Alteraurantiacibacter sp.]
MLNRMHFNGAWRDYQARILEEMDEHLEDARLHVVAAPGAGKTVLGLEIARRIGRPTLVFAPTIAIREQWVQRLCPLFLDRPAEPDEVSRDIADVRKLTLATYQALDSWRRGEELDDLVDGLNRQGQFTLVLDEAHHLRREWWQCLDTLTEKLTDVRVVALTATPPYDASLAEWRRYEELCGPIDLEIGIPELVRNGDLCPHQDHLVLSEPTEDALAILDRRRAAIGQLQHDLHTDEELLEWLLVHPWMADPEAHIEAILDAPEMLSAVLIILGSAGRRLPTGPLNLLGVSARNLPAPSLFWLERFLDGVIAQHRASFPIGAERLKLLKDRLHRHGLIEGGRVRLHQTRSVFRLMTSSLAKLDSIVAIAKAEQQALGSGLRMVILSDHIRAGELPTRPDVKFQPARLGVVPIFETLRRSEVNDEPLGVLTGSLVIVPRTALAELERVARDLHLESSMIRASELPACPGHVRLELKAGGNADLVRLVTALFARGDIRILVGTQSLLGEGWDAPTLNSLILASNTASFMLSNQMRGRAIRIDPAKRDKVSNIWHLATVDPAHEGAWDTMASTFNWGFLNDGGVPGLSDLEVVARRFKAFEGISNGASTLIESGIGRLGINPNKTIAEANQRTFAIAADRKMIAEHWRESLGRGAARAHVRETAAPNYSPRSLSWFDTLHALGWSAAGSGAFVAANELRSVASFEDIAVIAMGLAGVATLASLPRLAKAARLAWRNGSLEGSLEAVGEAVLRALHHAGIASEKDMQGAHIEVRTSLDGRKDIVLTGVSRATERQVMQAMAEILGPVQNPRYLLLRKSWLGWKMRVDYHAVPTVLGTRKEYAEPFLKLWRAGVGSSKLVYTRTPGGRRVLLRARVSSFASGFQRVVDRRSVWL